MSENVIYELLMWQTNGTVILVNNNTLYKFTYATKSRLI